MSNPTASGLTGVTTKYINKHMRRHREYAARLECFVNCHPALADPQALRSAQYNCSYTICQHQHRCLDAYRDKDAVFRKLDALYEEEMEYERQAIREEPAKRVAAAAQAAAEEAQAEEMKRVEILVDEDVADAVAKMQKKKELELKKAVEIRTIELRETMEAEMQKKFEMLTIEMEKKFETLTKEKNIVIDNKIDLENENSTSDGERDSVSSESDWEEVSAEGFEDK